MFCAIRRIATLTRLQTIPTCSLEQLGVLCERPSSRLQLEEINILGTAENLQAILSLAGSLKSLMIPHPASFPLLGKFVALETLTIEQGIFPASKADMQTLFENLVQLKKLTSLDIDLVGHVSSMHLRALCESCLELRCLSFSTC